MKAHLRRDDLDSIIHKLGSSTQAVSALPTRARLQNSAGKHGQAVGAQNGYALQVAGNGFATLGELSQPVNTNSATFEVWLQSTNKGPQGIFQLLDAQNNPAPFISIANDQVTVAWSGTTFTSQDDKPVTDGQWHHLTVVFDRGTLSIYKDGLLTGDDLALAESNVFAAGTHPQLASGAGAVGAYNGALFDIRVWTTARKQAEIQSFMYLPLTGQEAGLSLLWNFPTASVGNRVNGTAGSTSGNAAIAQMALPQQPPPLTVWMYPMLPSVTTSVGPVLLSNALIYSATVTKPDGTADSFIYSVDLQDNTTNWTYDVLQNTPPNSTFTLYPQVAQLTEADGILYAGVVVGYIYGDSLEFKYTYIHAIDASTGAMLWVKVIEPPPLETELASPLRAANGVLYASWSNYDITNYTPYAGGFIAFNSQGDILWENTIAVNATNIFGNFTGAALSNGVAVYGANFNLQPSGGTAGTLYAVNATAGWQMWSVEIGSRMSTEPIVVDGVVYVGNDAGTLFAFDLMTGATLWSYQAGGEITTTPALQGGTLYVGNSGGTFFAMDAANGQLKWEFATGNNITTDILIQDGVAYFATSSASSIPTIYAVDLATAGADVLTYTVPFGDVILFSNAGSSGVVYFYGQQTIYAINMENIIHEFQVDCKLIVEDYNTATSPPTPTTTSYRVTITLLDPNKTPRAYQGVKLWATDTLALTSDSLPYNIGPSQPVWLETDAAGQVTFAINALDSDGTPYLTLPAIKAWANFMQAQEAIVIYPDHENLASLATVQGNAPAGMSRKSAASTSPLYLSQAQGYDGQPMILSQYQSAAALDQIAQIVTNTVGLRAPVGAPPLRDPATTKYMAYPQSMPNVVYQADSSQPVGRAYMSGAVPHWVSTFDGTTGQPTFQQLTSAEAAQLIQQALNGAQNPAPGAPLKGIFTGIANFFKNVVKGVEQVGKAIWHAIESGIEAVIETAENIYHIVLNTVEDAVKAVAGFFKKIVADVKKVIQWLSWLFDWSDFVATHNQIKQVVQTNLSALKTWIDSQITAGLADVTTFFNNIQNSVDGDFDKIIASLQGKSLGNIRAQHNDTQQIFTQGGKNYHGPCMWLHQKTRENLKAANLAVPGGPGRHRIFFPRMPNQRPGAIDDSSIDDVFTAAFEGFLDAVKTSIEQQFASLPKEMVSLGHTFSNLFANKKTFLQNALADLLGLIKTIADDLIQVGAAIARAFLLMLQSIVNALVDYVTNPPAVEIPFVSSLYKSITGQPLSWFDLVAMVIAVPSTIMFKVFESLSVVGQQVAGVPKLLDWANFFIMIVTGIVDPIADISDDFPGLAIFDFILNIYAQGVSSLLIAWPFSTWQAQDYIFWAVQWVPVIFSGYSLYLSSSQSTWAKAWREWLQTWCTFEFGVIAGIFTTILAASNWQKYGKLTLAENIVSPTIYNVIEPLKLGGETAQVVMAIIKAAMALAYAIMNLVSAITTSTPAPALLTSSPLNLKETR